MRRWILIIIVFLLGCTISIESLNKQVVQISNFKQFGEGCLINVSNGTGFFVNASGHLITNYHVIEVGDIKTVKYNDTVYSAEVISIDPLIDLALLKINAYTPDYLHLSNRIPNVGEEVFTSGFPVGIGKINTFGKVEKLNKFGDIVVQVVHGAEINPGNSGGPLFDSKGNVIGVNYMNHYNNGKIYNYSKAIPGPVVKFFYERSMNYDRCD